MEEVLGFVTTLKEKRNCKVVLIFNDAELRDRNETYQRYREKVVDVDLVFAPSVAEAADLALAPDHKFGQLIREKLAILGANNIRLVKRMLANVDQVAPLLINVKPEIAHTIVAMTLLLTWVELDTSPNRPTLKSVRSFNSMTSLVARELLRYTGFEVLPPHVAYMPGKISARERSGYLDSYRRRLLDIEHTSKLFFHPVGDYGNDERLKPGIVAIVGTRCGRDPPLSRRAHEDDMLQGER
jgi:hypothetical protein